MAKQEGFWSRMPIGVSVTVGIVTFLGVVFAVVKYVVHSETSDLRASISVATGDISKLKDDIIANRVDISKTNDKIDQMLSKALDRAFPGSKGAKPTRGMLEDAGKVITVAQSLNMRLDTTVLARYGSTVARLSEDPSLGTIAWGTTLAFLKYRSFLNVDEAPKFSDVDKLSGQSVPHFELNFTPLPPPPHSQANAILGFLLWAHHAGITSEKAAKIYRLSKPSLETSGGRYEFFIIDGEGGTITLDDQGMRNIIISNAVIKYGGGPVILENVYFVGCTFEMQQSRRSSELAAKLLEMPNTTFFAS
jgi:hypothetical protein